MATKKPGTKHVGKADTRADAGREPKDAEQQDESDDRGPVPVFVRISWEANEILKRAATNRRTKATVIERLLENFEAERDPMLREKMLREPDVDPFEEHGELLELRSWAEHAFENGRYVWAGEMYKRLARHPNSSVGLKNICNYRFGLCLIRLSYSIRQEALKEASTDQTKIYKTALDTLEEAIRYTKKVEESLGSSLNFPRLVLYYNLASCRSLRAQYMVESGLAHDSALVKKLRTAGTDEEQMEHEWQSVGEVWRNTQTERDVDTEAEKAFNELQKIFRPTEQAAPRHDRAPADGDDLRFERNWMVVSAKTDVDFIFMRSDEKWKAEFNKWAASALEGRYPYTDAVSQLIRT